MPQWTGCAVCVFQLFELLNFLMENFVFAYIGVSTFTFHRHYWNPWFILLAFVSLPVCRCQNTSMFYWYTVVLTILQTGFDLPLTVKHILIDCTHLSAVRQRYCKSRYTKRTFCYRRTSKHYCFTGWMPFLLPNQQRHSIENKVDRNQF